MSHYHRIKLLLLPPVVEYLPSNIIHMITWSEGGCYRLETSQVSTILLNNRIAGVSGGNCDDCMSFGGRKQTSVEVLCQLPYPAMHNDYLYCRMRAVNGILAGGVSISKNPVLLDAWKPSIFTRLPKQRPRSCESVRKSFRRQRYSLNCHPWLWPIWLDAFSRWSPRNALRFEARHDFHLHFSRYRVNIAMSKVVHREENSIYSVNTRKTDTKASILLSSELAEVA